MFSSPQCSSKLYFREDSLSAYTLTLEEQFEELVRSKIYGTKSQISKKSGRMSYLYNFQPKVVAICPASSRGLKGLAIAEFTPIWA
jgi:hypothetical protein